MIYMHPCRDAYNFITKVIIMKKIGIAIAALTVAATTLAAIPASAVNHNENVLKYTPNIDGQIDAAYLESFYIEHEWNPEHNSDNFWANGKFEFDYEKDDKGNKVQGSVGYNTAYGWDCKATSYFLWDDDNLYVAVRVVDDDMGIVDDAHYQMACEATNDYGPWLQDSVRVNFTFKGMTFFLTADRGGKFLSAYKEMNYGQACWVDIYSWFEHGKNKDAGYYATVQTNDGYIVEMKLPVSESYKAKILKDGGNFKYHINVIDSPSGSPYGLDQARLLGDGIEVEGCNLDDFIVLTDGANPIDAKPNIKVKLSSTAPTAAPDAPTATPTPGDSQNQGGDSSATTPTTPTTTTTPTTGDKTNANAAQTGDAGIAVAAAALIAAAGFVVIKKRK